MFTSKKLIHNNSAALTVALMQLLTSHHCPVALTAVVSNAHNSVFIIQQKSIMCAILTTLWSI
jgi:hypothetical protein